MKLIRLGLILFLACGPLNAFLGPQCAGNLTGLACAGGPPLVPAYNCNQWISTVYSAWETCTAGACVADATSSTGYSMTYATKLVVYEVQAPCGCASSNLCSCANTQLSAGACIGSCVIECNPGPATCSVFTPWVNGACGGGGCSASLRQQTRAGIPGGCSGGTLSQCIPDASCVGALPPTITAFTANPATVFLGDPIALNWSVSSALPVTFTLNQAIGTVVGNTYSATPTTLGPITYTLTATNSAGSTSASANITVIPSPPRCGAGNICGDLRAEENPSIVLPNFVVELFTQQGKFARSTKTDATGRYTFTSIVGTYSIVPACDRTWRVAPDHKDAGPNNIIANAGFTILRVPAVVTINAPAGTLALFTHSPIVNPTGPSLDATYSIGKVTNLDDHAKLNLPPGQSWYMTCWKINKTKFPFVYAMSPSQQVHGGNILWPLDADEETCQ